MSDETLSTPSQHGAPTRRDFLYVATGAFAAVGAAASLWPFIDQMNPSTDVLAAGSPITVDLTQLEPGQQITVMWRSQPMFVVNRPPAALETLKSPDILSRLRDPQSQEMQQPAYAANWSRSVKPEYLVVVGICTHLGCIPEFRPDASGSWPPSYFCPCHGSRYDLAGRVFQGVPAPYNLPVPPYRFDGDTKLIIGENTGNSTYSLSNIEQM